MKRNDISTADKETNYNVYRSKADIEAEMLQSIKLFKEELLEIIETYLNPWLK